MIRKIFEASMFAALLLMGLACVFLAMNPAAFGQVAGVSGIATGTGYPTGSMNLQVAATGAAGGVTATLPAAPAQFTYICGFAISVLENGTGGTTSSPITVTGLDATFTYQLGTFAANSSALLQQNFTPCLPASAANTAITVNTTANAGATAVDINAWGYQLQAN